MKHNISPPLARALEASAIAGVALSAATTAQAAIVHVPIDVTLEKNAGPFILDLDGDDGDDFGVSAWSSSTRSAYGAEVGAWEDGRYVQATTATSGRYGALGVPLSTSDTVSLSPSALRGVLASYGFPDLIGSGPFFVGLLFNSTVYGNGNLMQGWLRLELPEKGVIKIVDAAFETDGSPIHIDPASQAVPEPSSLLLMASGAAGLLALRRRRRKPS